MKSLENAEQTRVDTVADILQTSRRRFPDRVAVKTRDGAARTYRELDLRSTKLANGLLTAGLSHGDRICAWLPDSVEYVELYLAAAKAGLVLVPVNARLVAAEAAYIIANADPAMLIWSSAHDEQVPSLLGEHRPLTMTIGPSESPADFDFEA